MEDRYVCTKCTTRKRCAVSELESQVALEAFGPGRRHAGFSASRGKLTSLPVTLAQSESGWQLAASGDSDSDGPGRARSPRNNCRGLCAAISTVTSTRARVTTLITQAGLDHPPEAGPGSARPEAA
eukprot:1275475-Rhodomonas_salina.1